ncbi:hypothetical protein ACX1C1_07360 [Paenibacillus sp. strain BS8-2]
MSKNVVGKAYGFAEVFNILGELPANMGILLGTAILFFGRKSLL